DDLKTSVMNDLREWGLKEGLFKYNIDKEYYLDRILTKYKNVAWAEMEIKGARLLVELIEKQLPPELEQNTPCDIIASKDGIIEEIIPLRGEAVVKSGQTVSEGDVLITGKIFSNSDQSEKMESEENLFLVHAQGIVKARVWYQKAVKVPLVKKQKNPTGNSKKSFGFQIRNNIFNLQLGDIPYTLYEKKILREFRILPKILGEIGFSVTQYNEMEIKNEFLGIEGASREAEAQLLSQLADISKDDKITQKKMEFMLDSDEKAVIGSMIIEVVEDIGQKREIK
ncbi:MAG: sporulation protein YqfD, partial [Tepidanaerobacteraceae bacterium]|nr:sporulation protein YqfD [Tepidanaerobacteraceae bacterium]